MSVRLELDGIREFHQALRNLPADLSEEAGTIIEHTADRAKADIQTAYPEGPTGNLKAGVSRQTNRSRYSTSALVKSRAKHANIFERGTRQRQTFGGANRGTMPQPPEHQRMIPIAIRLRRQMIRELMNVVERAGFKVR